MARRPAARDNGRPQILDDLEARGFAPQSVLAMISMLPLHEIRALGHALATGRWDSTAKRAGQRRLQDLVG